MQKIHRLRAVRTDSRNTHTYIIMQYAMKNVSVRAELHWVQISGPDLTRPTKIVTRPDPLKFSASCTRPDPHSKYRHLQLMLLLQSNTKHLCR